MSISDQQAEMSWYSFLSKCALNKIDENSFDKEYIIHEEVNNGSMGEEWVLHWIANKWVTLVENISITYSTNNVTQCVYVVRVTNYGIAKYLLSKVDG